MTTSSFEAMERSIPRWRDAMGGRLERSSPGSRNDRYEVRWRSTRWTSLIAAVGCVVLGSLAQAATVPVDCDTTDDFCVGDPCETADVLLITVSSCVLDFGSRTLIIGKKIVVPNGGTMSLTAGSIQVEGKIAGKNTKPSAGDASHVSLIAIDKVTVDKKIDVSGRYDEGTILIDAGGSVLIRHRLFARAKGGDATASGGTVTVEADALIESTRRGKIDVRGKRNLTGGGQVNLRGQLGVKVAGRVDVRGEIAGQATIESAAGFVLIEEEIRAKGLKTTGGTVEATAAGDLTVGGKKGEIDVGGLEAGTIVLVAGGTADVANLDGRSKVGLLTGSVAVTAGTVNARRLNVRGTTDGGFVVLTSTTGDVTADKIIASGSRVKGGTVIVHSAANALLQRSVDVEGALQSGEMRFSTVGDLMLGEVGSAKFEAGGPIGGVIEGLAGGDLTALGDFLAATGGCIGLSAGGTLDTSQATFDVPLSASCP